MKRLGKWKAMVIFLAGMFCLGGCMNQEKMFVSYMEEKYGEKFAYIEPTGGQLGRASSECWMRSEQFPEQRILAARYQGEDGKFTFYDNYMAVLLHEDAWKEINSVVGTVFDDYQLFFFVTPAVLTAGPDYTLEDYLKDPAANLSITIVSYSDRNETSLSRMAEAFGERGIAVHGLLFFADSGMDRGMITEDNIENYEVKSDWFQARANFTIESDGTVSYERWR